MSSYHAEVKETYAKQSHQGADKAEGGKKIRLMLGGISSQLNINANRRENSFALFVVYVCSEIVR